MQSAEQRILSVYFSAFREDLRKRSKGVDLEEEQNAITHLAQWALRYSPIVAPDCKPADLAPGDQRFYGINLDLTGCERLFQGEHNIAEKISASFSKFKLQHRLAIAPSLGAAWALSRYGEQPLTITTKNSLKPLLATLPIAALRIPCKMESSLKELNISTLEDLTALPRKALLERYGKVILDRLNQLHGVQHEPINPIRILTLSRAEQELDGAVIDNETIKAATFHLLGDLLKKLADKHEQPTQIVVKLKTISSQIIAKEISLTTPTYNRKHIAKMLDRKLDTVRAPFGIEKISLIANRTEQFTPVAGQFLSLHSTDAQGEKSLGELLDTLITTLGRDQLLTPSFNESFIPEEALSLIPLARSGKNAPLSTRIPRTDRPSLLLNKPQSIRAMATLPDGPPFWLRWRDNKYEITKAVGPERISPEWWKEKNVEPRDYFKVQIPSGTWLWIFRELESSRWFLQGIWA